ncbi:adenosylcobinamide kinase/adenosylcobinamide-phosphate guanylyltransferase [Rhodobium orientis]|uniref:Bifunctional adenosylcobalamin biosynthesis protein n=1 Tax=Rhodobium orientis TaxID=34017 RepID=A0A327JEC8_9HYPH|nr:bifunctional adenosylcobinamide kinase/adenosylcobinamide-phosphate guanylyltransferase [Rhodobium orientis]MBB4304763.1 adenosylcobinamide kinase/adenosylcobinamide-phosphate guanylyltransferase [Rhodobium orientis]MBK5947869.1 bifunctional adenosylcobinamide kinase/adenosylcobinamide-phosphate guanylyltransferase [Rhodobium orientis]RAI24278.1 bifunctional adenosylcobinamide kinase/adenosylcobinamide-phosphate guanylyltransferase [Rhodobium orientis]
MGEIILVTGGARSGKSVVAEERAKSFAGRPVYIATSEPYDDEMRDRVAAHIDRRGDDWETVEEPLALAKALDETDGAGARLVDCLTIWLANFMLAEKPWEPEVETLLEALKRQKSPVVLVTNEVGMSIVPENALARAFRDAQGSLNQKVAEVAGEVTLVVCGQPLRIK